MNSLPARLLLRGAACVLVSWVAWQMSGAVGFCISLGAWGVLLAHPLIELAGAIRHGVRATVWSDVEGRHYVFHGIPVQVLEDADRLRWIRAADVRRCVGFTASDGALATTYPEGWRRMGRTGEPHFGEEALLVHLAKERSPQALRFRQWAEREVVFPARRRRERLGIRPVAPR